MVRSLFSFYSKKWVSSASAAQTSVLSPFPSCINLYLYILKVKLSALWMAASSMNDPVSDSTLFNLWIGIATLFLTKIVCYHISRVTVSELDIIQATPGLSLEMCSQNEKASTGLKRASLMPSNFLRGGFWDFDPLEF